ncbi:hypothetical protein EYZ11_000052 [Aspergillus tanneri]|uniref:Uncharacterized protein n=1 Tax=Aspergillus tanneri TaxID=1220188 RepID=A0A4S3JYC5_9EURO|nr:hypothetical protein EYZ11_000052 [Aspergillus tanneri]
MASTSTPPASIPITQGHALLMTLNHSFTRYMIGEDSRPSGLAAKPATVRVQLVPLQEDSHVARPNA